MTNKEKLTSNTSISPENFERFYQAVPGIIQQTLTNPQGHWGFLGIAVSPNSETGANQHTLMCGSPHILALALKSAIEQNSPLLDLVFIMLMDDPEISEKLSDLWMSRSLAKLLSLFKGEDYE